MSEQGEQQQCSVCGISEAEANDVFGVGLVMNERTATWMCQECDYANGGGADDE